MIQAVRPATMSADRKFPMIDFQLPETRYAQSGDASIAYQVMGDGPIDMIIGPRLRVAYRVTCTNYPVSLRSCGGWQALRAW